jgi:Purple acid Phosphatase, N-terminal domain
MRQTRLLMVVAVACVTIAAGMSITTQHCARTSNRPGGADEHFGLVKYGTDPHNLNLTAKGHIRLNRNHPYTVFRVRLEDIKPGTTYYYTVDSMEATGELNGVKSTVYHFSARK